MHHLASKSGNTLQLRSQWTADQVPTRRARQSVLQEIAIRATETRQAKIPITAAYPLFVPASLTHLT